MASEVEIYVSRTGSELRLAAALFKLSKSEKTKTDLGANPDDTFYSAVISHAYYSIFYAAKALLLTRGVKTKPPEIYMTMIIRADELLFIFKTEKKKRGEFTYNTVAQANVPYA